jgi:hypothetical protein
LFARPHDRKARWLRETWEPWRRWLAAHNLTAAEAYRVGVFVPADVRIYERRLAALAEVRRIEERRRRLLEARPR